MKFKLDSDDMLVSIGDSCKHAGETIFIGHLCKKWRLSDGSVDLTEVDVVYFETFLFAKGSSGLSLWRNSQWENLDHVEFYKEA